MSEASPPRRADHAFLPPPTIYDPTDDDETPSGSEPAGTVVLLLVGDADSRWAAQTALELSTAWARSGRRIVLADLHLENPVLHESIGDGNLEGVVDVFLYGVSIARSAQPVAGRGFFLIPAGTYTADLEGIYHHPRWPKLIAGFRDADASLILFAPAGSADLEALSSWVNEVLVLGTLRDPASLAPFTNSGTPIRARIVAPAAEAPPRGDDPLTTSVTPASEPSLAFDPGLHLPPPPVRSRPHGRRINNALWLVLAIVALASIGYAVGLVRPDLLPWSASFSRAGRDSATQVISPDARSGEIPVLGGDPLPFSVQVIAFQSLPAALERLIDDRARATDAPLYVSPETIDGIVYYRILAGAVADSAAARELRDSLVAAGVVDEADATGPSSLIQSTPFSFALDSYPDQRAAEAAADSLLARNIPAYPVAAPFSDSTRRWQLYAGAYRDSASAAPMRELLLSAGLTPTLVSRTGTAAPRGE